MLCILWGGLTSIAYASEHKNESEIKGTLTCSVTGNPIGSVHITALEAGVSTISATDGSFTIYLESIENESLFFSHVGFNQKTMRVTHAMLDEFLHIELSPARHSMSPVTVIAHRTLIHPSDRLLSAHEAFKPIDAGAFLLNAPNVSGIRRGGFGMDPVIRGFANSRLNIRVDGLASTVAACPNRMDPPTSHIRITDIERVEIYHGPHALQFGPAFGGTVNFIKHPTPEFKQLSFNGDIRAGLESNTGHRITDTRLTFGNPDFTVILSGGLSQADAYTSGGGLSVPAGFRSYDYGADLYVRLSEVHRFSTGFSHNIVRDADFPALPMDMAIDDTYKMTAGYAYLSPNPVFLRSLSVDGYYNLVDHEMNNHNRESFAMRDAVALAKTHSFGGKVTLNGLIGSGTWTMVSSLDNVSVEGNRFVTFLAGPNTGNSMIYKLWQDARITNTGLFAGTEQFWGSWTFTAGLRLDHNTADASDPAPRFQDEDLSSEYLNISFSTGISNSIGRNTTISLFAGRGLRSPDVTERFINFLSIGRNAFEFAGNPNLKPEINNQVDALLETIINPVNISFNVFAAYTANYISAVINPDINPVGMNAPGVREFINAGNALFTGFELSATTPVAGILNFNASGSYTYGRYTDTGEPVAEIAPFEASVMINGVFFNALTPMIAVRKVFPQGRYDQAFGESRTTGFWLTNVEVGYDVGYGITLNTGVRNLFNQDYMEHLNRNFNPQFNSEREKLMEPGRRFFAEFTYRF